MILYKVDVREDTTWFRFPSTSILWKYAIIPDEDV